VGGGGSRGNLPRGVDGVHTSAAARGVRAKANRNQSKTLELSSSEKYAKGTQQQHNDVVRSHNSAVGGGGSRGNLPRLERYLLRIIFVFAHGGDFG